MSTMVPGREHVADANRVKTVRPRGRGGRVEWFVGLIVLTCTAGCYQKANERTSRDDEWEGAGGAVSITGAGDCGEEFTLSTELSPEIPTVATVTWSTTGAVESAHVDFGRQEGEWEYQAPVPNPELSGNETMLLGMKPDTTYSLRVTTVNEDGDECRSPVQEITTGPKRSGLPPVSVTTRDPSRVYEGFTIACVFGLGSSSSSYTFILDKDGDYVWWYQPRVGADCVRARMSYDGQYMWSANGNVPGPNNGKLSRVRMDGTAERTYNLPYRHHDIAVLPDERIAYFEYEDGKAQACDVVKELVPETGASLTVYNVADEHPSFGNSCHSNSINWWPEEGYYTLSVLDQNSILAFERTGEPLWILGGRESTFSGADWRAQHGHHLLSSARIVLFNNQAAGGSAVLEYQFGGAEARLVWDYPSSNSTQSMGDVKRLPNDNTLITYSNQGVIREIDDSDQVVREIVTSGIGYTVRRASLYGPPPPYGD